MTDIVEQAARVMAGGQEYVDGYMNLAQALADAGLLTQPLEGLEELAEKELRANYDLTPDDYDRGFAGGWYAVIEWLETISIPEPARTVPTREEIAKTIHPGYGRPRYDRKTCTPCGRAEEIADAILALLDEQPTVNEVKAQALEYFADEWCPTESFSDILAAIATEPHEIIEVVTFALHRYAQQARDGGQEE